MVSWNSVIKIGAAVLGAAALVVAKFYHMKHQVRRDVVLRGTPDGMESFIAYPFRWTFGRLRYLVWLARARSSPPYQRESWFVVIDEAVILGGMPFPAILPTLARLGVRGVVSLCEECDVTPLVASAGMHVLRLPTIDYTCPALEDIHRALEYIRQYSAVGARVYVHCKSGKGRSATVVLCYLALRYNLTLEKAYSLLREVWPKTSKDLLRRATVHAFYQARVQGATAPWPAQSTAGASASA